MYIASASTRPPFLHGTATHCLQDFRALISPKPKPRNLDSGVSHDDMWLCNRPRSDPLAGEPGEPFELTLWRGGEVDRNAMVSLRVRAYARRLANGQPVGLLLIQEDASSNESLRGKTAIDREVAELNAMLGLREQELEEHEHELASLRAELQSYYEESAREAGRSLKAVEKRVGKPVSILSKGGSGSQQRVAWGAPNKVMPCLWPTC